MKKISKETMSVNKESLKELFRNFSEKLPRTFLLDCFYKFSGKFSDVIAL